MPTTIATELVVVVILCAYLRAQANSWGAGSSNHLSMMKPVMASWTNPGAVAAARERATNPGVWMDHGGVEGPYHFPFPSLILETHYNKTLFLSHLVLIWILPYILRLFVKTMTRP